MDRASIEERLALAERHVAEGAARIRRQRELEAESASADHQDFAAQAALILKAFEESKAVFVADRDRLIMELNDPGIGLPTTD